MVTALRGSGLARWAVAALVAAALVAFPFVYTGPFPLHVMIMTFLFAILGVAWNIMGGYAGMFSFGQAAFFGIGAYTSSYLLVAHGVSPWIGLVVGGVVAALVAACIGYPCSRLRGHYFAIASIAFAEIVRTHFNNWKLINAAEGLTIPMLRRGLADFQFHGSKAPYYFIALAMLLIALAVSRWVAVSRIGFYFRAIKESHELAMVLGISFVRWRLVAIMLSAFLSAMAGTLYAQYILYLDPESVLILAISVQVVLIAMLGGAGSVLGPVIGAAILVPLSEITRVKLGHKGTGIDLILYGALITLISVYQPRGVWGLLTGRVGRSVPRPGAPGPDAAAAGGTPGGGTP
jgi:branched-chain amino acid transport system permease protein